MDFGGGPLTSAGESDIFVARLDAAGNLFHAERFGAEGMESVSAVALDGAGNALMTGYYSAAFDFAGLPMPGGSTSSIFLIKLAP